MLDPHINLFRSYSGRNQLVENNLTRALVQTLKLLSPANRHYLMMKLLAVAPAAQIDFSHAKFSLQDYKPDTIDLFTNRYLLLISTNHFHFTDEMLVDLDEGSRSIADAWVYDGSESKQYCVLVEAKIYEGVPDVAQLLYHARQLGISGNQIKEHLISRTWVDLLIVIEQIFEELTDQLTQQESLILCDFAQYIKQFGYQLFKGLTFEGRLTDSEEGVEVNMFIEPNKIVDNIDKFNRFFQQIDELFAVIGNKLQPLGYSAAQKKYRFYSPGGRLVVSIPPYYLRGFTNKSNGSSLQLYAVFHSGILSAPFEVVPSIVMIQYDHQSKPLRMGYYGSRIIGNEKINYIVGNKPISGQLIGLSEEVTYEAKFNALQIPFAKFAEGCDIDAAIEDEIVEPLSSWSHPGALKSHKK